MPAPDHRRHHFGLLLTLVLYVGAIFCVGFLGGSELEPLYPGYSTLESHTDGTEMMLEFNPDMYFGTMGAAMFTLFNMAILAEWAGGPPPMACG